MTETIGISENPSEGYAKQLKVNLKANLLACQFYDKLAEVE